MGATRPNSDEIAKAGLRTTPAVSFAQTAVWGVLNVTADSFSDGGAFLARNDAIAHGRSLLAAGADVVDVGGESSRPKGTDYGDGAPIVGAKEEAARVGPVIAALVADGAKVSIDTVKAEVATAAIEAGAVIVNDISGGRSDALLGAVADAGVELVLMHNRQRGTAALGEVCPQNATYDDVLGEVVSELQQCAERAEAFGIGREKIIFDPGLGFAKTPSQSGLLLRETSRLVSHLGRVLIGASRKSFIAHLSRPGSLAAPDERIGGTAVSCAFAVLGGAEAVRVHDVGAMLQATRFSEALLALPADRGGV